jgi:uncharacterized membrane protein
MQSKRQSLRTCQVCHRIVPGALAVPGETLRPSVVDEIVRDHPDWSNEGWICRDDLHRYRARRVEAVLASERGELSDLERDVVQALSRHETLAKDVEAEFERRRTLGETAADRLAGFGGSWTFLGLFAVFLAAWMGVNTFVFLTRPFDPYPFILLNLVLSTLAAVQAPVIMMSQNRQEDKDRVRAMHDYRVNLKAELEIRQLHEKIDHLLSRQWHRLVEIQQVQIDLLEELSRGPGRPGANVPPPPADPDAGQ